MDTTKRLREIEFRIYPHNGEVESAVKYVKRIKNAAKQAYAVVYLDYLLGKSTDEPARPADLSFMAAQAVEQELRSAMPTYRKAKYAAIALTI